MNNILVINVNWVGDVIFTSPIFRALKAEYPESRISCMAVPRVREVLESIPFIDEIIIYDEKGKHKNIFAKIKLIFDLSKKKFDVAFLLHRSWTRAFIVYLAGIPRRVGYDEKNRGLFLTHKTQPLQNASHHRSDYYINIIESFGVKAVDRTTSLTVSMSAQDEIQEKLNVNDVGKNEFLVVINPGGNWDLKRWPKENFALLINMLISKFKVKVVISGASKDISLAQEIASLSKSKPAIFAGQTSFKQLVALMKRADLVISNDSGPIHIASSVGTNVIGIFGPTHPEITGPRGKGEIVIVRHDVGCNNEPCYNLKCPDNICMQSITINEVIKEFEKFLNT